MKNIIIGTAGHVDHGKTALIRALTGIETDRLKEEKKRGITIELGFAYLDLPSGERVGIVDVPGHERFIKNMLAGAGGVDLALLVIALDEGVMPQTREHLDILTLLGIERGVVALTKKDMVDDEWQALIEADVAEALKGTFLEGAPMLAVSAHTGEGIAELKAAVAELAAQVPDKDLARPFRLPVDRVFSVDGFGTVVTGTLVEGQVSVGDEAVLLPSMKETRVRSLQVHGRDVQTAYAGQRTAINLAGLAKADLERGDVVAKPGSMTTTQVIDVSLDVVDDARRSIKNGSRTHLHYGTRELLCKVTLLDADELTSGHSGYAQLRCEAPIAVKAGDRFILRFYSPLETVGGGVVLDIAPARHKRHDDKMIASLQARAQGSDTDRLASVIADMSAAMPMRDAVVRQSGLPDGEFDTLLAQLLDSGAVYDLGGRLVHSAWLEDRAAHANRLLRDYHDKHPLRRGMGLEELRRGLGVKDAGAADALVRALAARGAFSIDGAHAAASDFVVRYTPAQQKLRDGVEKLYRGSGFTVPSLDEVQAQYKGDKALRDIFDALSSDGVLVRLSDQLYMHGDAYGKARDTLLAMFENADEITLADYRDAIGSSRKYAVALLEHFDSRRLTKKVGDARQLVK